MNRCVKKIHPYSFQSSSTKSGLPLNWSGCRKDDSMDVWREPVWVWTEPHNHPVQSQDTFSFPVQLPVSGRCHSHSGEGVFSDMSLPSQQYQTIWDWKHSVKSREADRNMLRFCVGVGGIRVGMTDGFNNKALKLLEQSKSSEPKS